LTGKHQAAPRTGDNEEADERETELAQRLRALRWPEPPAGARERGLEALRPHLEELSDRPSNGDGGSPGPEE
jgi:hypothetical protein